MKVFIFISFLLVFNVVTAQERLDRIPKSEKINKAREQLLNYVLEIDLDGIKAVENQLENDLTSKNFVTLYFGEKNLINYWTNDYSSIRKEILSIDSIYLDSVNRLIPPEPSYLFLKLVEKSINRYEILVAEIDQSSLPNEEKEFLKLELRKLLQNRDNPAPEIDGINDIADVFLLSYPNSDYRKYVNERLIFRKKLNDWGLAVEFFSGYGRFQGGLANKFSHNVPFGVAFDITYKNISLYLRDYIGFSRTKQNDIYDGVLWESGSQARVFIPEASIGYPIINNRIISLSPFFGVGGVGVFPTSADQLKNPDLNDAGTSFNFTWTPGLNLDIKFKSDKEPVYKFDPRGDYLFIRLRYAYLNPKINQELPGFDGVMHQFTVGFGLNSRGSKRVVAK